MSKLRRDVEALTLGRKKPKDYDPEDDHVADADEADDSSEDETMPGGREHYETVGKSTLRKPETAPLDPKYGGVAVSRRDLETDDSHLDPFAPDDEQEEADDDPFAKPSQKQSDGDQASDSEASEEDDDHLAHTPNVKRSNRKTRRKLTAEEGYSEAEDSQGDSSDLSIESDNGTNEAESDEIDEDGQGDDSSLDKRPRQLPSAQRRREQIKTHLSTEVRALAAGLSQAATADAKKGQAVRKQYQTFERLVDTRMKLQKGLIATEELAAKADTTSFILDAEDALQKAQEAALSLFNTIGSFRDSIASTKPLDSRKRKRFEPASDVHNLSSIYSSLLTLESPTSQSNCTAILDKWSNKVKASDPTRLAGNSKAKFRDDPTSTKNDKLTAILNTYIINEQEKHFRTTSQPQPQSHSAADRDTPGPLPPYSDTLFYQSLLRDLIATRSAAYTSNTISTTATLTKLHTPGNKSLKDTKASKGRKIRYTVHEKLQGFMAAEGDVGRDTSMWTERGKDEFFGSLFGGGRVLIEDEEDERERGRGGDDDYEMNDVDSLDRADGEAEALRLFRT